MQKFSLINWTPKWVMNTWIIDWGKKKKPFNDFWEYVTSVSRESILGTGHQENELALCHVSEGWPPELTIKNRTFWKGKWAKGAKDGWDCQILCDSSQNFRIKKQTNKQNRFNLVTILTAEVVLSHIGIFQWLPMLLKPKVAGRLTTARNPTYSCCHFFSAWKHHHL